MFISNPQREMIRALIAELRASRKVVEAAREVACSDLDYLTGMHGGDVGWGDKWKPCGECAGCRLAATLTELSSINVKGSSE